MKRSVFRIRWSRKLGTWAIYKPGNVMTATRSTKREAVYVARRFAREHWEATKRPTQLMLHNKNGQIQRGGNGEATYGLDPRKSKG